MHAWEVPFQSYEAKSCLSKAKDLTPLVSLIKGVKSIIFY